VLSGLLFAIALIVLALLRIEGLLVISLAIQPLVQTMLCDSAIRFIQRESHPH